MRPTTSRAVLAAATTAALLGGATTAQAAPSPAKALKSAKAGKQLKVGKVLAIKPGKVKHAGGTTTYSNATVLLGKGISGTGVTAKATSRGLVLTGGTYVAPSSLTDHVLTASTPIKVALSKTGVSAISGKLASTARVASAGLQARTLGADLDVAGDAVPAAPTGTDWTFNLGLDLSGVSVTGSAGPASLDGRIGWNTSYAFTVAITDLGWNGATINAGGSLSGASLFAPPALSVSGVISGEAQLAPQVTLRGANLSWGAEGLKAGGTVRLACSTGSLDASAALALTDLSTYRIQAAGNASSCTIGQLAILNGNAFTLDVQGAGGKVAFSAGFGGASVNVYSQFVTSDADAAVSIQNAGGRIASTEVDGVLNVALSGTGVAEVRDWARTAAAEADPVKAATPVRDLDAADRQILQSSMSVRGTLVAGFDVSGTAVSNVAVNLTDVKFAGFDWLTGLFSQGLKG